MNNSTQETSTLTLSFASTWLILGILIMVSGLILANVYMAANLSHQGIRMSQLSQEEQQLQQDIHRLESAVVEASALHRLQQAAPLKGFNQEVDYQYLYDSNQMAVTYP